MSGYFTGGEGCNCGGKCDGDCKSGGDVYGGGDMGVVFAAICLIILILVIPIVLLATEEIAPDSTYAICIYIAWGLGAMSFVF